MKKLLFGALLGAAAMYYLDPTAGPGRRRKLSGGWADKKDNVLGAARSTASAVTSVSQGVGGRVSDLVGADQNTNGQVGSHSGQPRGGAAS